MENIPQEIVDVIKEHSNAENIWGGEEFDKKHTLNDWVTFITMYASKAARFDISGDKNAQYDLLIKSACLALTAARYVREDKITKRHYDK